MRRHFMRFVRIVLIIAIQMIFAGMFSITKKQNTLDEIELMDGRIGLKQIREWGGEKELDINKMFYEPMDIACDKNGNVYVLEKTKILAFDKEANFIKKLGGPGQGPGEFLGASHLDIDTNNTMAIYDSDNRRIQIISLNGDILGNIPLTMWQASPIMVTNNKEIVMYNTMLTTKISSLWQFYNYQGKLVRESGIRLGGKSAIENNSRYQFNIADDNSDNIYAAAVYQPIIYVYSKSGEMNTEISYELPFKVPEIKTVRKPGGEFVEREMACRGIAVDLKRRIFILCFRKIRGIEERKIGMSYMSSNKNGSNLNTGRVKPNVDSSSTDLFQILIFNESGKITSSNKMDIYADKIRIFNNHLYVIDSYVNMNIHEYIISN